MSNIYRFVKLFHCSSRMGRYESIVYRAT